MKFLLEEETYDMLLSKVIALNENPDADRCNIVNVQVNDQELWVTLCFNENKRQIKICKVQDCNQEVEIDDADIIKCCFNELINVAIDVENNKLHKFYKEKIEPATECCELNQ